MMAVPYEYVIFVLVASVGTIQIAASVGGLRGLLLFKSPLGARLLGVCLLAAALVFFYATDDRNLNDHEGGMDGNGQSIYFALGSLAGVLLTLLVSSIANARMRRESSTPTEGLTALGGTTYVRALRQSLSYWWREWRARTKPYFFG